MKPNILINYFKMESQFEKLPWTHGGLILLQKIEIIIEANGGIEAMHQVVSCEMIESSYQKDKRRLKDAFKSMIKHRVPNKEAADILHIDYYEYCKKIAVYKSKMEEVEPLF